MIERMGVRSIWIGLIVIVDDLSVLMAPPATPAAVPNAFCKNPPEPRPAGACGGGVPYAGGGWG